MTGVRSVGPRRVAGRRVLSGFLIALGLGGLICALAWSLQVPAAGAGDVASPVPVSVLVAAVSLGLIGAGWRLCRGATPSP